METFNLLMSKRKDYKVRAVRKKYRNVYVNLFVRFTRVSGGYFNEFSLFDDAK